MAKKIRYQLDTHHDVHRIVSTMYKDRSFYEFVGKLDEFNEMVEEVFEEWFSAYPRNDATIDKKFNRICWEIDNTTIGEEEI